MGLEDDQDAGVALGVPAAELAPALAAYTGVKRRLQLKGEAAGVQVIDSYAHHPTEMTADLEAMRAAGAEVTPVHDKADAPAVVAGMAEPGDLVLTMGAGDVTDLGPLILDRLAK